LPATDTRLLGHPARSLVTTLTEISRLLGKSRIIWVRYEGEWEESSLTSNQEKLEFI
jgi:hypothetical protein